MCIFLSVAQIRLDRLSFDPSGISSTHMMDQVVLTIQSGYKSSTASSNMYPW